MSTTTLDRRLAVADSVPCYLTGPLDGDHSSSVVVLPELFGLTPHVLAVCDRLADAGAEVVCPDLFHRTPGAMVLPESEAGRATGLDALGSLTADQLVEDVRAAASLLSRPVSECGLLGLSVGGYAGFLAAVELPLARIALAYPGWLTSTTPPISSRLRAIDSLGKVEGGLLVVVGGEDRLIQPEEQAMLQRALTTEGHDTLLLPGVGHGFLSPAREAYDAEAADRAWRRILAHLDLGG
ncbi:dienelactone hydrolase family protein [Nocardioides sp. LHG3406-4]|uniref:dienelactone hydrolase family protein n=1 Tax=Nocardioides sp. LHG3406-4 TaxID=2804575 RepID=UPI003CF9A184